jgi:uncharacterized damage-inducible protein DinB
MSRTNHICLMAKYNEWMNVKVYEAAMSLDESELIANRKAFFGSILGTLNHLAVADTIWLKRFANHPASYSALKPLQNIPNPTSLDQALHSNIQSLWIQRRSLDQIITEWASSVTDQDLDHVLHYSSIKGVAAGKNFFSLIMHFFNHQTHHRGQTTTLLSQAGVDVGVTDLLAITPNEIVA